MPPEDGNKIYSKHVGIISIFVGNSNLLCNLLVIKCICSNVVIVRRSLHFTYESNSTFSCQYSFRTAIMQHRVTETSYCQRDLCCVCIHCHISFYIPLVLCCYCYVVVIVIIIFFS